ncbi:MAG: F0F1 ATP synthase subunit B [Bradymonadaceae bacterium]
MEQDKLKRVMVAAAAIAAVLLPATVFASSGGGHGFNWQAWFVQLINFAIFAGGLVYFLGPMVQDYFEERRQELIEELEQAEEMREEAEAKLEEYTAKLEAFEQKRDKLLEEYEEQGEREKEKLIEEAEERIEQMRADAEDAIDREVKKAVADLEEETVELAVEIAEGLAYERLDSSSQHALIESYVSDLANRDEVR